MSRTFARQQPLRTTAELWGQVSSFVLQEGEIGYETDTKRQKTGDGETAWAMLPYDDAIARVSTPQADAIAAAQAAAASDATSKANAAGSAAVSAATSAAATDATTKANAAAAASIPLAQKGANNGVASLSASGKLLPAVLDNAAIAQAALDSGGLIASTEKGANSGVATLGGDGKVPEIQLGGAAVFKVSNSGGRVVNVLDFGAKVDGVTDDLAAFRAAIAAAANGKAKVVIPPGSMRLVLTGSRVNLPAGTRIEGDDTIILLDSDQPGAFGALGPHREVFSQTGDSVKITGCSFVRIAPFAPMVFYGLSVYRGQTLENGALDGARNVEGSAYFHGLQIGNSGTSGKVRWSNFMATRCSFTILMTNSATGTVSDLSFDNCWFQNNYADDLLFNSPNGSITDVRVTNCHFRDNMSATPAAGFAVSFANVKRGTVRDCSFSGYYNEAVHIEDYADDIKIIGNSFNGVALGAISGHLRVISGASRVLIQGNSFDGALNVSTAITMIEVQTGGVGNTPGGRPGIAPRQVTISENTLNQGTNCNGIYLETVLYYKIVNNRFFSNGSVNSGVYGGAPRYGLYCYTGTAGVIQGNTFLGLLYGIRPNNLGIAGFGPATTIVGNQFLQCYVSLPIHDADGGLTVQANSFSNCVKSISLGRGVAALPANPVIVANNNAFNCAVPMSASIGPNYTLRRAGTGTVSIGSGVSVPIQLTDAYMPSGTVLTFSGGGVLTLTVAVNAQSSTVTGNLATAGIAPNETAVFTAALPSGSVTINNVG